MSAVIYDTENTYILKRYDTLKGAKGALTRARNTGKMRYMGSHGYCLFPKDKINKLEACTVQHFIDEVDYEVEVTPLMSLSGKTIKIKRSAQGGCTDPSTERYWSM